MGSKDSDKNDKVNASSASSSSSSSVSETNESEDENLKLFKLKDFKPEDSANNIVQIPSDDPLLQEYKNQNNNSDKKTNETYRRKNNPESQSTTSPKRSILPNINMNFGRNDEGNESSAKPLAEQDDYNAIDDPFEAQFMGGSSMPKLCIIPQTQDEKPKAIKDGTVQVRNEKEEADEMDVPESRTF